MVAELYASVADHSEAKVLRKYCSYDCLLIDEVGYVEVEPVQVGLFFTLMQKRHKTKTTLITSNLGFSDWGSFLQERAPDGRPDRSADGNQPCDQHEELSELAEQAGQDGERGDGA